MRTIKRFANAYCCGNTYTKSCLVLHSRAQHSDWLDESIPSPQQKEYSAKDGYCWKNRNALFHGVLMWFLLLKVVPNSEGLVSIYAMHLIGLRYFLFVCLTIKSVSPIDSAVCLVANRVTLLLVRIVLLFCLFLCFGCILLPTATKSVRSLFDWVDLFMRFTVADGFYIPTRVSLHNWLFELCPFSLPVYYLSFLWTSFEHSEFQSLSVS